MHAQQLLQAAITAFGQGQIDRAGQLAQQLLQFVPEQPDALHLLALCARQSGQAEQALQWFRRSLTAAPTQSVVWSNYGNLLQHLDQAEQAEQAYLRALNLAPQQADTWLNAGLLALRQQLPELAKERLQKAQQCRPDDARSYAPLAQALAQLQQVPEALQTLDQALTRWPGQAQLLWQKAQLLRDQQQAGAAAEIIRQMLIVSPHQADLHFMAGCLQHDLGQDQQAEAALLQAITQDPLHIGAHEALNQLYWEQQNLSNFLQLTHQTLTKQPDALGLRYCLVTLLIQTGDNTAATELLEAGIALHGRLPDLLHALGVQAAKAGQIEQAAALTAEALQQQQMPPAFRVRAFIDAANYAIRLQRLDDAIEWLEQARRLSPLDQEIWAYLGTCWRLQGNDKTQWLNNYAALIDARPLPTPPGYQNLAEFLAVLNPVIRRLHTSTRQPLDQSVRGGTQTLGRLLAEPNPVIQQFRVALEQRIEEYLQRLPQDPNHPLLSRNSGKFRFSGSWSVRLADQGFHSNHVHPQGWLSACTYLELPDCIRPDDPLRQGWLKLGETSLLLGDNEEVAQAICPAPGLVVLFPSFVWHGTYPFHTSSGQDFRMTAPCDIMPA
jgi:tetratricopeptide (TPR) repeat protein